MLRIPTWKIALILFICLFSIYYSLPSIFPAIDQSSIKRLFPEDRVNLGLDLRGGAYILLEVDIKQYQKEQLQQAFDRLRAKFRQDKIKFTNSILKDNQLEFQLEDPAQSQQVKQLIFNDIGSSANIKENANNIYVELSEANIRELSNNLMMQTIEIIRRRIDETGTKEVDIQREGEKYILLQVPGIDDPSQIKRLLGKTAKLSFHLVDESADINEAFKGKIAIGSKLLPFDTKEPSSTRHFIIVKSRAIMTGDMLADSQSTVNMGMPIVNFKLNNIGAKIFGEVTTKNKGNRLAIVLDGKVISAPMINEPIIGGNGMISGNFTVQSAHELALLLRAGALPAPIYIAEERSIGPSLGQDSIAAGTKAVIIGAVFVVVFMFLFYGFFGLVADIALLVNLFMIMAILAIFGATLTLPGIAGMVLTLGMAVDANVLIFERIKEEIAKGRTALAAMESGYKLAFATILDSNLTTIVAAIILYILGSGPIKGFAVTLSIGILCSMFTAISLTKIILAKWYKIKQPKILPL